MEDFTPITSQEEFDSRIKERLTRERDSVAKKYSDYDDLKETIANQTKQLEEVQKQLEEATGKVANHDKEVAELTTKLKGYETDSVKTRIALEVGLPYELHSRLVGDDEESIRKDAESLSKQLKPQTTLPLASTEPTPVNEKEAMLKELSNSLVPRD